METETISVAKELEEGEVEDDICFDDIYVPLERPICNAKVRIVESDGEDNPTSSDSDSSDDGINKPKVRKLKTGPTQKPEKKNCKIWCSVLEAETVASDLTDCNLDENQKRIRGLAPYQYPVRKSHKDYDKVNYSELYSEKKTGSFGKRNHEGQYVHERKFFNDNFNGMKLRKGVPKKIPPLTSTHMDSEEKIAREIAEKLNEEKDDLILRAIQIAGKKTVISIYEETRKTEKSGGLSIMNGARRRTSGGVFFYLLKTSNKISNEKQKQIFLVDKQITNTSKKIIAKSLKEQREAKKKELNKDDFPTLLSRTEIAIREFKERKRAEETIEVENPPPSPATDGRDCSSDGEEEKCNDSDRSKPTAERAITVYDDLFDDVKDDMDVM